MKIRQQCLVLAGVIGGAFLVQAVMLACGTVGGTSNPDGGLAQADAPRGIASMPSGAIVAFGGKIAPEGWLICDGAPISRSNYGPLYAAIGNAWGAGDGATTFNLPDLRGVFLRGVDAGANRDPDVVDRIAIAPGGNVGGSVGTLETDSFRSHDHGGTTGGVLPTGDTNAARDYIGDPGSNKVFAYGQNGAISNLFREHTHSINAQGGHETRPINAAVSFIIKL